MRLGFCSAGMGALLCALMSSSLLPTVSSAKQFARGGLASIKQNPLWVYEAETETTSSLGEHQQTKIVFDNGRYRIERTDTSTHGSFQLYPPTTSIVILNSIHPPLVWSYDQKAHSASISEYSAIYYFASLAKRDGIAAMRQRYRAPERVLTAQMLSGRQGMLTVPFYGTPDLFIFIDPQTDRFFSRSYRRVGAESVAGQKCTIFESGGRGSSNPGSVDRYWVEPKSHLVLKLERIDFSNPRAAQYKSTMVTKKITFLKSLPASAMQLPPGTTAYLPESMKDISLPPGVVRARMQGPNVLLGFDPQTMFKPQSNDTGNSGGVGLAK